MWCSIVVTITIPRRVVEAIRKRGHVDVEAFVLEAIEQTLGLDPQEELETRFSIAEHMLRRAREELEGGDPVQASEKLYKAVEECIKILACLNGLEECDIARREGAWWSKLLGRAARRLSLALGEPLIVEAWSHAYDLHVHGFHEHAYTVEEVRESLPLVEKLVEYTRRALEDTKTRR